MKSEAIRHCACMDTQASKTEFVLKIVEKLEKNHLKLANDFKSSGNEAWKASDVVVKDPE